MIFLSLVAFSLLCNGIGAKLFSNDSEFDDDKSDPSEVYKPVMNTTKLKLSKQFKLMQKFMKANARALRVDLLVGESSKRYVQIQGAELQLACSYEVDSVYTTNEENLDSESSAKFTTVEWRKDALDLADSDENFRHTFDRSTLMIRPSLYEDGGLYECTRDNQVLGTVTIEVYTICDSLLEALFCMLVISFSGFFPFFALIVARSFFANQMASFDEQERLEFLRQKKAFEIANAKVPKSTEEKLLKTVADYYNLFTTKLRT